MRFSDTAEMEMTNDAYFLKKDLKFSSVMRQFRRWRKTNVGTFDDFLSLDRCSVVEDPDIAEEAASRLEKEKSAIVEAKNRRTEAVKSLGRFAKRLRSTGNYFNGTHEYDRMRDCVAASEILRAAIPLVIRGMLDIEAGNVDTDEAALYRAANRECRKNTFEGGESASR